MNIAIKSSKKCLKTVPPPHPPTSYSDIQLQFKDSSDLLVITNGRIWGGRGGGKWDRTLALRLKAMHKYLRSCISCNPKLFHIINLINISLPKISKKQLFNMLCD